MADRNRGCLYWLLCVIAAVVAVLGLLLLASVILMFVASAM